MEEIPGYLELAPVTLEVNRAPDPIIDRILAAAMPPGGGLRRWRDDPPRSTLLHNR